MTARDDLLSFAQGHCYATQESFIVLVDAYAHELAEKIRANIEGDWPTAEWAADLIDPEVKK